MRRVPIGDGRIHLRPLSNDCLHPWKTQVKNAVFAEILRHINYDVLEIYSRDSRIEKGARLIFGTPARLQERKQLAASVRDLSVDVMRVSRKQKKPPASVGCRGLCFRPLLLPLSGPCSRGTLRALDRGGQLPISPGAAGMLPARTLPSRTQSS